MPTDHPTIDLHGYQRQRERERQVTYTPVSIALLVVGFIGLGVLGYGLFSSWGTSDPDFWLPVAGFGMILSGLGGLAGYMKWQLSRLKCPGCAGAMPKYVIDLPDDCRGRWIRGYEIDGRYYCEPFGDDNDRRSLVRLMKAVRACETCRTYLDLGEYHQQTCLDDDWERIHRRFPNHEQDVRRREAWGNALGYLWIGAILLSFLALFLWSGCD
jgi:hypothetical protein